MPEHEHRCTPATLSPPVTATILATVLPPSGARPASIASGAAVEPPGDRERLDPDDGGVELSCWQQRAEQAERRVAQLETALVSRAAIDQAKGLLMGVFGLGPDEAFSVLVRLSQHTNIKLAEIAERLLCAARRADLGALAREQLTQLLSEHSPRPRRHGHYQARLATARDLS